MPSDGYSTVTISDGLAGKLTRIMALHDLPSYAEAIEYATDTTRERVPSGSTHRYQIGTLSVNDIRSMLRNTTRMLIARARQHGELTGKLWAAIDVTKGVPFTGDVEGHENDILGYKDGNQYYQWAVLKIVGLDVPLVLDAIPRKRGQSKDEIVEQLLEYTTDMADLDLVMMDREFDAEGVKETCEEYGVYYLNPTRIFTDSDEAETIAWMYRNSKRFHVTEEVSGDNTPTRKQLYLPKRSRSDDTDDGRMDAKIFIHMIERLIHRYCHRWGIENGFTKQKHFMVRATPTERDYRFFNVAFACVLYNVWRLVDLLVKLAIDGEHRSYAPLVDANQFLTVAKQCYGLDPPD